MKAVFPGSSVVEQLTVNQLVGGSNPSRGANTLAEVCEFQSKNQYRANKHGIFPKDWRDLAR